MARHKKKGTLEQKDSGSDELLWGINAVREALDTGKVSEVLVQKGKGGVRLQEIIDLARAEGVRVRFVDSARLGVPASCRHQGVTARRAETEFLSLEAMLAGLADQPEAGVLLLDSIQDPRNLGSILRSALAAGFHSVILTRERSAPVSGTVARTSAGALAHLDLCQVTNLSVAMQALKEHGFWLYGAVVGEPEAVPLYETDFSGKVGLVIGSEGKGIRPLVRKQCDRLITIPMQAGFDSLNVSVAAAVMMFEIRRPNRVISSTAP